MRSLDDLRPEEDDARRVFAEFGFTLFSAQKLENRMLVLLQLELIVRKKFDTHAAVLKSLEEREIRTMGAIDKELGPLLDDAELRARLKAAVASRNYFAHHFFRDRVGDEEHQEGRVSMILACAEASSSFQDLAAALDAEWKVRLDLLDEDPDAFLPGLAARVAELMEDQNGTAT